MHLREQSILLSEFFHRFRINIRNKYEENLKGLTIQKENQNSDEEALTWKAYKLTLHENSNFLHMITFNQSDKNQDIQKAMKETIEIFTRNNFDRVSIYNTFVKQFAELLKQELESKNRNLIKQFFNYELDSFIFFLTRVKDW